MTELEILITNGKLQKRIIWISISSKGIYSYFTMLGAGDHSSYHKDGSLWQTFSGVKHKIAQFQPLDSFKGSHQITGMVFSTVLSGKPAVPPYKMKRLDSAVYIDIRPYNKVRADVGINISLLEPKKYSLLEGIESFAREIHLYPYFNPWLLITVYESKSQR